MDFTDKEIEVLTYLVGKSGNKSHVLIEGGFIFDLSHLHDRLKAYNEFR